VNVLGGANLDFLDYIDPPVGENGELYPFTDDLEGLVKDLEEVLHSIQPQVILTHGPAGEYGHPAHVQASEGISRAVASLKDVPFQIYAPCWLSRETGKFEPEPDILLDISPWREVKVEAALCHKTQHDLFVRHGSARAGRQVTVPEMIRDKEALIELQHQEMNSDIDLIADLLSEIAI
jgi:LmbE family N-acetylglucosaminyl deacetylase